MARYLWAPPQRQKPPQRQREKSNPSAHRLADPGGRAAALPPGSFGDAINPGGFMKLSDRKIDLKKREEGAWVTDIPEFMEVALKVRGSGNKDWARMEAKLIAAVPRQRRVNGLEPEDRLRINGALILNTSLLDWRGIENGTGEPQPYSKEAASKYLTNPEYEAFVWACVWAANVVAEQGQDELEQDAKN
jgi:hypothetical protein